VVSVSEGGAQSGEAVIEELARERLGFERLRPGQLRAVEALAGGHDVLAIEIRDPREQELPDAGELWLVDPETGRQLRVDTRDAKLRARFAAAAAEERSGLARTLGSLGVRHHVLSTSGDWLRSLAVFLKRTRR
jgi:uncharacterized protein (DUF58 family)